MYQPKERTKMSNNSEEIADLVYRYLFLGQSFSEIQKEYYSERRNHNRTTEQALSNKLKNYGFGSARGRNKSFYKEYTYIFNDPDKVVSIINNFLTEVGKPARAGSDNVPLLEEYIITNNKDDINNYTDRIKNTAEYIQSIEITNFKSIQELEIDLGRITCLVGNNTAGKSSVLQGIQFSISNAQVFRNAKGKNWREGIVIGESVGIHDNALIYKPSETIENLAHNNEYSESKDISGKFNLVNDTSVKTTIKKGKNRNNLISIESSVGDDLRDKYTSFTTPFSIYVPGVSGVSLIEEKRSQALVAKIALGGNSHTVLRNILLHAKNIGVLCDIERQLTKMYEKIIGIDVSFEETLDDHITVTLNKGKYSTSLETSSTGELQVLQILSYIYVYKPVLLLLDEPDSHLHPGKQEELIHLLYNICAEGDRKFQILLTTHSRNVLNALSNYDDSVLHHIDKGIIETLESSDRFKIYDTLLSLGALDELDRNSNFSYLILTEDSKTGYLEEILRGAFNKLNPNYKYGIDYKIIPSGNGSGTLLNNVGPLIKLIKKTNSNKDVKIIVHRDRDFIEDDKIDKFKEEIESIGASLFITSGSDIESYYADIDHVCGVYPEISKEHLYSYMESERNKAKYSDMIVTAVMEQRYALGSHSKPQAKFYSAADDLKNQVILPEIQKDTRGNYRNGKEQLKIVYKYIQDNYSSLSDKLKHRKVAPENAINDILKVIC